MPRSANAVEQRLRRRRRRRDRHRQRHHQRRSSDCSRMPAFGQQLVHQQRGLARRGRALERRRRHADDHPPAVEAREHVAQRERARLRVELVAALDQARASPRGRGRRRARRRGRRRRTCRRRSRPACAAGSIDGDLGLHELHPGLHDVAVRVDAPRRPSCARTSRRASRSRTRTRRSGRSARRRRRRRARPTAACVSSRPPKPAPSTTTRMGARYRLARSGAALFRRGARCRGSRGSRAPRRSGRAPGRRPGRCSCGPACGTA